MYSSFYSVKIMHWQSWQRMKTVLSIFEFLLQHRHESKQQVMYLFTPLYFLKEWNGRYIVNYIDIPKSQYTDMLQSRTQQHMPPVNVLSRLTLTSKFTGSRGTMSLDMLSKNMQFDIFPSTEELIFLIYISTYCNIKIILHWCKDPIWYTCKFKKFPWARELKNKHTSKTNVAYLSQDSYTHICRRL